MKRRTCSQLATTFLLLGFGATAASLVLGLARIGVERSAELEGELASRPVEAIFKWIAFLCFFPGCWFMAKYKGRTGWWSLLALFCCIGPLVVIFLPEIEREEVDEKKGPDWEDSEWEGGVVKSPTRSPDTTPASPHASTAHLELPAGTLRASLDAATRRALDSGALRPIETEAHLVEEAGVQYLVRVASNLARKDEELAKRVRQERDEGQSFNPFLPYEEAMFVADVSETHVALLNKFNVIDHHLLLVTREFRHQEELLDLADFRALDRCLAESPSLGFYNGGVEAGASQPHKHLQLVPLPMAASGPDVPIEPLLGYEGPRGEIATLERLPFTHLFIALDPDRDLHATASAELELELYRAALDLLGIASREAGRETRHLAPYNLLLTREWMLLVPRSREHFGEVSINALGFAGSFFVRDEAQLRAVEEAGPSSVLGAVSGSPGSV